MAQENKKTVLCIGCYHTGNVGDGTYKWILERLLTDYDVYYINNNKMLSKNKEVIGYTNDYSQLFVPDYVIIGGGGMIMNCWTKERTIEIYLSFWKKFNIPVCILSCGVQYSLRKKDLDFLEQWTSTFNYAQLIVVRSVEDYGIVYNRLEPKRRWRLHVLSDLAYSISELRPPVAKKENTLLYIPTSFLSIRMKDVRDYIDSLKYDRMILLPFDGTVDVYPTRCIQDEIKLLKKYYPKCEILRGRAGRFKGADTDNLTLDKIYDMLDKAKYIVTGRLHGLILGKALGCDVYVGCSDTNKLIAEQRSRLSTTVLDDYKKMLKLFFSLSHDDPDDWSEDMRNTVIVRKSKEKKKSVKYMQTYDNETLVTLDLLQ